MRVCRKQLTGILLIGILWRRMLLLTPWRKNYYGKESWNVKGKYIENELSSFFYLKQRKQQQKSEMLFVPRHHSHLHGLWVTLTCTIKTSFGSSKICQSHPEVAKKQLNSMIFTGMMLICIPSDDLALPLPGVMQKGAGTVEGIKIIPQENWKPGKTSK